MWDIIMFAILCGIYVGLSLHCVILKCGTNVGFGKKHKKFNVGCMWDRYVGYMWDRCVISC